MDVGEGLRSNERMKVAGVDGPGRLRDEGHTQP